MIDNNYDKIVGLCKNLHTGDKKAQSNLHNNAMEQLAKLYYQFEKDRKYAENLYISLMRHEDDRVRLNAAASCLALNVNITDAQKNLKQISKTNFDPSVRFEAEMTLDIWKEQGYLKF